MYVSSSYNIIVKTCWNRTPLGHNLLISIDRCLNRDC